MKIENKKSCLYKEVVTIKENFEVKVRIGRNIITLDVDTEDGEVQYWKGKTPKEQQKVNMLTIAFRKELETLLENEIYK
jgi:hypothetical protein